MTALYKRFFAIPILFCALFCAFPAVAQDEPEPAAEQGYSDLYTVENVEVDITAENAVKARTEALDKAQIEAYKILAGRILGEAAMESEPDPDPLAVGVLVQDFEVTNEQLSSVRYKGVFTVRFRPKAVDSHFQYASQQNMYGGQDYAGNQDYQHTATAEGRAKTLILPFYQYGRVTTIWDDQINKWMNAWRTTRAGNNLIVPIGDALDLGQIRNDQALTYNYDFLQGMMSRYGAENTVVMIATERKLPDGSVTLEVNSYHAGQTGATFAGARTFTKKLDEPDDLFFARVVREMAMSVRPPEMASAIQNPAPSQEGLQPDYRKAPPPGPLTSYKGRAVFEGAREWVELKKTMQAASGMRDITVKGLKPTMAEIEVTFAGDPQRLSKIMAMSGVAVRTVQPTDAMGRIVAQAPAMFEFSRAPGAAGMMTTTPNYR